jgi:pilus assembly protein CpaB
VKSRFLTITLAVVLALVGVVAILAYVRQANERAVNGLKAETVMVAKDNIAAGTSLGQANQEGLLTTEKVPESSLSEPAVQSVTATNTHLVVTSPVAKGQLLLRNMLGSSAGVASNSGGSIFNIPADMVAVTINMCVDEAVADYVVAGSNVAVFDLLTGNDSQVDRTCSTGHQVLTAGAQAGALLVLAKAKVLAVGVNPETPSTSGSNDVQAATNPSSASLATTDGEVLVTLAVNEADAQRLILLDEVGLPYMALLGSNANMQFGPAPNEFQP